MLFETRLARSLVEGSFPDGVILADKNIVCPFVLITVEANEFVSSGSLFLPGSARLSLGYSILRSAES
jgi:hypothetical protein